MANQVTVRFESTAESQETEKVSYMNVSFKKAKADDVGPFYRYDSETLKYTEVSEVNDSAEYYVRTSYSFQDDVEYFILTSDGYKKPNNLSDENIAYYIKIETVLLSGPIEIFATVDTLFEEDAVAEKEEVALMSDQVTDLAVEYYNTSGKAPIVYVERVSDVERNSNSENLKNRGAYFIFQGFGEDNRTPLWQEILLGTHSHTNVDGLNSLSELSLAGDGVIVSNGNGTFSLKSISELSKGFAGIPALPESVLAKINALKKYEKLNEPTYSEDFHLDADLDALSDTYDWKTGSDSIGNCRDLYRSLLKSDNKLYVYRTFEEREVYKLTFEKSDKNDCWLTLDSFKVNYNSGEVVDNVVNAISYKSNPNYSVFSVTIPWNIVSTDKVLLFNNGEFLIEGTDYNFVSKEKNIINVLILNKTKLADVGNLTVLCARDVPVDPTFNLAGAITSGDITLGEIDKLLLKAYIEGEFARKPNVDKLYLTTDEYGSLVWENRFIPGQSFKKDQFVVEEKDIDRDVGIVTVTFEEAYYDIKTDFPLILVDEMFAFDITPEIFGEKLVYKFPISSNAHYSLDVGTVVTLLLIRNAAAGSLAEELAKGYVSKADAISILSHGKLNLEDYAKQSDLIGYARLGHTHTEYALRSHDHDYRYANFHHTHPELFLLLEKKGATKEEVNSWLKEIKDSTSGQIYSILANLGYDMESSISDRSVRVDSLAVYNELKELTDQYGITLPEKLYLSDILEIMVELFKRDTVTDSQVILEADIPVRLVNGPIGGLTENKRYYAGDNLKNILTDILNPHITLSKMRELLTPDYNTEIKWYIDNGNDLTEIDLSKVRYSEESTSLLFSIKLNNKYNNYCQASYVTQEGKDTLLCAQIYDVRIGEEPARKYANAEDVYYYESEFDFTQDRDSESLEKIYISWKSNQENDVIFDNYGVTHGLLNENNDSITIDVPSIDIIAPEILTCFSNSLDKIELNDSLRVSSNIDVENAGYIVIAALHEDNIKVIDVSTDTNITKSFLKGDVIDKYGTSYQILYYHIYDSLDEPIKIKVI